MENYTYSEIKQAADYNDQERLYNVVALGNGENPAYSQAWLAEEDEIVPLGCECPFCTEQRMDALVIDDDGERVTCATCGSVYPLPGIGTRVERSSGCAGELCYACRFTAAGVDFTAAFAPRNGMTVEDFETADIAG